MNNRNLSAAAETFDSAMRHWMAAHAVPRGSVAVTCHNRLVFAGGYGGRGVNERVPVWSLSKAITALCIASLIRDDRLGLNEAIGPHMTKAFEKFGGPTDERLAQVTVAQLLSHRNEANVRRTIAPRQDRCGALRPSQSDRAGWNQRNF